LRKVILSPANSGELKAGAYSTGGDGTPSALTILYECVDYKRKNVCAITKKRMELGVVFFLSSPNSCIGLYKVQINN